MSDVDALRAHLIAELEAATDAEIEVRDVEYAKPAGEAGAPDAAGVLAAMAHVAYYNRRYDAGARTVAKLTRPADWPLPTAEALAVWLLGSPEALPLAVDVAEAAWLVPTDAHTDRERWAHRAAERWLTDFAPVLPGKRKPSAPLPFAVLFLTDLVLAYLAAKRPRAPLFTLVAAWPVDVDADERRNPNIPGPLAWTLNVIRRRGDDQPHLPFDDAEMVQVPPADVARFEVPHHLPWLEPPASKLPWAVLNLLDFGASRGHNGPVPVPTRVGWELLLHPKPGDWHAEQATVTPTIGALAAHVWPTTDYKATKHGPLMYQAARWLNDPDNATWFRRNERSRAILVVTFFAPPVAPYHKDDKIGAHVVLPDGGRKVGPQYDAHLRRVLAASSYRQHRVYLAAVCLFDRHATVRGYLVQRTLPVVERNEAGYVLRADGTIATEKDGRPSRRATHRLAVHVGGREPNPAAEAAYSWLEGHDAILVAHHRVAGTLKRRNLQRQRTLATLEALRVQGIRRRNGGVIVTREAVLDFEARYRSDGVLTGAELAALPKHQCPSHTELEAVRLLPAPAHFAAYEARQDEARKRRP